MFAEQAVRLLRERWKSARSLAEELYAIFTSEGPASLAGPLTVDPASPGAAPWITFRGYSPGDTLFQVTGPGGDPVGTFKIENGNLVFEGAPEAGFVGGNLSLNASVTTATPTSTTTPTTQRPQQGTSGQQPVDTSALPAAMPATVVSGSGAAYVLDTYPGGLDAAAVRVTATRLPPTDDTLAAGTWLLVARAGAYYFAIPAQVGAMPGRVTGGSGSSYTADVYPAGTGGAPQSVAVTQLQIDEEETIPADTWAVVVKAGGSYFMQVPVWLAPPEE